MEDEFAVWLFYRFNPGKAIKGDDSASWNRLSAEDKQYWRHESEAVGRAFLRGGFRK